MTHAEDLKLLRTWHSRIQAGDTVRLSVLAEINAARRLQAAGLVQVAIPSPNKGRYPVDEQDPAIVQFITVAGQKALSDAR